jgi:hypothetical protein
VTGDAVGLLVGWPHGDEQARLPLVHGQHGLAVFGEQHQVGFPMAGRLAVGGIGRAFRQGNPAFDEADGATAFAATTAALALGPRQVVTPAIVLVTGDLRVDEAVDGLVADDLAAVLTGEPAGDLLGRPALRQTIEDGLAQAGLAFEARSRPAPRPRLLLRKIRLVASLAAAVALYLPSNARWRAIQS